MIKFTKRNDGSQTVQGSQSVQGSESVQSFPGSQTGQCSQPDQTSQTVYGSQPSASLSHPFSTGTNKKRFKSPAKRKKFTNMKDLLDGYQPWDSDDVQVFCVLLKCLLSRTFHSTIILQVQLLRTSIKDKPSKWDF
ncbi:hypothetical protein L3X38_005419 [Prunus dulcis]|uniref:Uncharacterized protein n=1 Tax=Prunus dulcis TaxID=3755 RepID=A0AAD4ZQR9_PRUDU|nr:hypothetical protein L3X38_005419 [Prunus dulcis]